MATSNELIKKTLNLLDIDGVRQHSELSAEVFKHLIGILQVVTGDSSYGHQSLSDIREFQTIEKLIIKTIHSASKPYFYSDAISLDYFECLTSFIGQNTEAFMSPIGIEYLNHFVL